MKSIFYLFILCPVFCVAQWTRQTSNTSEGLNNTFFVDNNYGFAVGNNGAMVKTTNGGANWTSLNTGLNSGQILGVYFTDKKNGWICGTTGVLMKTTDSGVTWSTYNTGLSTYLSGIHFTGKKIGFVAGQNGIILKTTDAGVTWNSQTVSSRNFINIYFRDSLNGYACGGYNTIMKTTDGGINWGPMYSISSPEALYSVKFINSKIGYSVGTHGIIIKTTDGGVNWVQQTSGHTKSLYSVYFLDSLNGWATCNQADSILHTTDGGKNWVSSSLNYSQGYYCVYFPSKTTGYITGMNGAIFKLIDKSDIHTISFSKNNIVIYPQPDVNGNLNIQSGMEISAYTIYDISGRKITSKNLEAVYNSLTLDISQYANGAYLLELNCKGEICREKFIINR